MKLSKSDLDIYHRVLLTGLSGAGKSTLAAALAAEFKLIWIDIENGKDVLCKLPQAYLDNIQYVQIPDSASYPIAAQTLMALFKNWKATICHQHGKDNCPLCKKAENYTDISDVLDFTSLTAETIVVLDGGTQLASSILSYVCKDKPVEYKPERDDWGGLRKYSEFFASQFQAFPGNFVMTCLAIEAEMEDNKTKLVPSFGSKDMSSKVAKAFSDVVYIEMKNKKHVAISSSTASNMVLSKSRTDFMIELLPEPSLIPLFKNTHISEDKKVEIVKTDISPAQKAASNLSSFLTKK